VRDGAADRISAGGGDRGERARAVPARQRHAPRRGAGAPLGLDRMGTRRERPPPASAREGEPLARLRGGHAHEERPGAPRRALEAAARGARRSVPVARPEAPERGPRVRSRRDGSASDLDADYETRGAFGAAREGSAGHVRLVAADARHPDPIRESPARPRLNRGHRDALRRVSRGRRCRSRVRRAAAVGRR
jgi:hypothetical protein